MSLVLLPGSEHGVGREFFICEDAAFVTPGRFEKILPCPHEDEQEQRLSSASINFLRLRQIHDSSGISPALNNALSTLLSCCSQHFFPVRVLTSFIHLPVVTLSDNDSKQIAAATSFRMSALLTLRTFLVKVKKFSELEEYRKFI